MKKILRVFNNGMIAEMTSGLSITSPALTYEEIDVTEKSEDEIRSIKEKKRREKIDKKPS